MRWLCLGLCLIAVPATALAAQGPPIPLAIDLAAAPVGSWAEYELKSGSGPTSMIRWALVARNVVEATAEDASLLQRGGMVTRWALVPERAADGFVERFVVQIGSNEPMNVPVSADNRRRFSAVDPAAFLANETVTVRAGTFKAKHYRAVTPDGAPVDYWTSDEVPPFGAVRVEGTEKDGSRSIIELVSRGHGAKAAITRTPTSYDQAAINKQVLGDLSSGASSPPTRQPADEKVELAFDDTWTAVYPCSTTDHFSALLKITRQGQQIRAVIQRTSGRNDPATLAAGMVAWQGQLPRASVTTDDLPLTVPVVSTYPKFSSTGIGLKGRYRRNNVATIVSPNRIEISGDEYPTTRGNTIEDAQKVIDQLAMDMLDRLEKLEAEKQEQKASGAKRSAKLR